MTVEEVRHAARQITIDPLFKAALLQIKAALPDSRLIIVSDANTVFIEEILDANGLSKAFDQILTNHAEVKSCTPGPERLAVEAYTTSRGTDHDCPRGCPANLCTCERVVLPFHVPLRVSPTLPNSYARR